MLHYTKFRSVNSSEKWITFIHGAGGSSSIWYNQVRFFKKYFNVLLIDLRGHGKSTIPAEPDKLKSWHRYSDDLINKALELEGTITGEHGIGLQKKHYLLREHPDNLPVMKAIKRSIDVNNIMNPGKVFDLN